MALPQVPFVRLPIKGNTTQNIINRIVVEIDDPFAEPVIYGDSGIHSSDWDDTATRSGSGSGSGSRSGSWSSATGTYSSRSYSSRTYSSRTGTSATSKSRTPSGAKSTKPLPPPPPPPRPQVDSNDESTIDHIPTTQERAKAIYVQNEGKRNGFWVTVSEIGIVSYIRNWRFAARKRRLHHILRDYEEAVKAYYKHIEEELEREIEDDEAAVLALIRKREKMRRRYQYQTKIRRAVERMNDRALIKYVQRAQTVKYYCDHLHDWAIEHHDIKLAEREAIKAADESRRRQEDISNKENQRQCLLKLHQNILHEDRRVTQQTLSVMRKAGMVAAVNTATDLAFQPPQNAAITSAVVDLYLKEGVDFKQVRRNGRLDAATGDEEEDDDDVHGNEETSPFDVDLTNLSAKVLVLQCHLIGERGAICLAADFVRGACPNLEALNLAHNEIHTRGLGKLLRGLAMGKIRVKELDLRGNFIVPRGLEYLRKYLGENGLVEGGLKVLDLRQNEVGDEGLAIILRMLVGGTFETLEVLRLEHNQITDRGFRPLATMLKNLQPFKCPNLEMIALGGNKISAACKRELHPLPPCFTF